MPGSRRRRPLAAACLSATFALAATLLSPLPAAAAEADGRVLALGDAPAHGSPGATSAPATGLAATPSGDGYVVVTADGTVRAHGDAADLGSAAPAHPVVDVATPPAGDGYWVVARNGGVHSFGDAAFLGGLGDVALQQPVVGIEARPSGAGYWLVAADGGVFSFGESRFYGSTGAIRLVSPIVAMAAAPDGRGYWLAAGDGGVFSFGSADFRGSLGGERLDAPVIGITAAPRGDGYWLAQADGTVTAFGSARDHGSVDGVAAPVAALDARPQGDGYWLVTGARTRVKPHRTGAAATFHAPQPGDPPDSDFDRLAQCESGQRWHLNTGNGYYGGLQFSPPTWRSHGGTGLPHEHPRETQIEIARRQWRASGWRAWPHCSKQVGLA